MTSSTKPVVPVGDFPIGTVIPFAGNLNQHDFEAAGWFYCNGNSISRTTYANLFAVIGIAHGSGDGVSTFNLPDYRGTFLRGVNGNAAPVRDPDAASRTAANIGGNTGNKVGSMQGHASGKPATAMKTNETGDHTHTVANIPNDKSSSAVYGHYQAIWNPSGNSTSEAGAHQHSVDAGGDAENRPVNAYVYHLIRFQV